MEKQKLKLPDELEAVLIQAAAQVDSGYWTIGDVTADLVTELALTGVTKTEIRKYVASYTRFSPETIRDLEWMARVIPPEKRTYNLSRHQYRACLAAGERWEEFALRAVESAAEYNGMTAPVAVIRAWVKTDGAEQPDWVRRWERLVQTAEGLMDIEAPVEIQKVCAQVLALNNAGVEHEKV